MKRGFTIVEMLAVIAIIAVLMGIVTTAASQSIKGAREKRAAALCNVVQTGLATYHAQKAEWPGALGGKVKSGNFPTTGSNNEIPDTYELTAAEVRECVKALVDETKKGNPLMDISGLFVSRTSGERGTNGFGLDFISAVRGTKTSRKKMSTSEMYYGYQDKNSGKFRRFRMVYSIPTDHLSVLTQ